MQLLCVTVHTWIVHVLYMCSTYLHNTCIVHAYILTHMDSTCIHTCIHTYILIYMYRHTYIHVYIHTHLLTYMYSTCTHNTCIVHAHILTYMYSTCIHMYSTLHTWIVHAYILTHMDSTYIGRTCIAIAPDKIPKLQWGPDLMVT